ncbi:MAG: CPBP family intramembrane metalloprotease [Eubacteriales bacterium]|nr:CPBP family intramembrane metalloprotease [Eubacteriales bacterium]MDD4328061.1 CPBP family intramembrane metalloprotease [Eubacteriales bacterium]MDD4717718.1 CPBP family intramembrane metalloprotease [Eubacteriales bacterium]
MTRSQTLRARDAAGTLLLIHSLLAIIVHILKSGLSESFSEFLSSGMPGFVSSTLIMQGICILLPTLFVIFHYGLPADIIPGTSTPSGGWTIMSATIGIPAAIVFTGINNGFIYVLYKSGVKLPSLVSSADIAAESKGITGYIVVILLSVLLPGIVEELMFRGVIQGSMASGGRVFASILLQAAAFSVFHVNIMFIAAPFFAGLLLGYIRHKTGTVYAGILAHMTMNLTILFMAPLLPTLTAEYVSEMTSNSILYASVIAATVASVALIPMLIAFSSVKSPTRYGAPVKGKKLFPVDLKFILGSIILIGSMFFSYFTNR